MIKKILVPLDGSGIADRILTVARPLLVQEDTEVTLLRVIPDKAAAPGAGEEQAAREHIARLADRLSLLGGRVRGEIARGDDVADAILEFARELGPSLIVMGTHGRSSSARWIRGSVAERVLQRTEYPVFLANPLALGVTGDAKPLTARKILVPLDGSELAAKVLPLVSRFARVFGAEVVLFHVIDPRSHHATFGSDAAAIEQLLRKTSSKKLDDVSVRTLIAHGSPAGAILDVANEEHPDIVALTTHGQGGASPWVFGSVAEQVLRHCAAPLLVYRTSGFVEPARSKEGALRVG